MNDIVEACLLVMRKNEADYDFFNVGTGEAVTIKKVAETLINLYGKKLKPKIANRYRVGDIRHCSADIAKIGKIGFAPRVKLREGLKNLVEWGKGKAAVDGTQEADRELEKRKLKL